MRHYVGAPVLSHWHHGAMVPWHRGVVTSRSRLATSSSSSTLVQECNPHDRSTRVRDQSPVNRYSITRYIDLGNSGFHRY
jgi:alkylated DNA nucleotide flippase Atl1